VKKAAKKVRNDPGEVREVSEAEERMDRSEQLCRKENIRDALLEAFKDIEKGFDQQAERSDNAMDNWDIYNCVLGNSQFYNGNSQIFVPIVRNAVEARKTRFVNQLFPMSGRHVEVTSEDGTLPQTEMALLEHYVRQTKLRTRIAPALCKNGDIEGQVTVQVTWEEQRRHVAQRVSVRPQDEQGAPLEALEEIEDIEEEELVQGAPEVRVIADCDLLVLPVTATSLEDAIEQGGSVTTLCRWTPAMIMRKIALDEIDEEFGEELLQELKNEEKFKQNADKMKPMIDAAGIKGDGRGKYALVYRTWIKLTIKGERRLCLAYYAGRNRVISAKRNPYWSDRIDILSAPIDQIDGCFKGVPKVDSVADLQYQANDACNEAMDSAAYALMPIIMTDPEKNPKVGSMILSLAAIWETDPQSTQFAQMPPLWKDGLEIVATAKNEIFQSLSVNPAQITGIANTPRKKPNQAEIANEQQIDILTTSDAVTVLEDEIFSPILLRMLELDHQFRDKSLRVREYGPTGMRSNMIEIPLVRMDRLYQFRWFGVEANRNAQQMQQQIAGLNVLRGIPPQLYQGYRIDLGPVLSQMIENLFGPRLAPLTFRDSRMELSMEPEQENELLAQGFVVPVHIMDDHQKHIQAHMQAAQMDGDPKNYFKVHIMAHLQAIQAAQQQQMQQQQPQPQPGGGGRGGGQPRIGASPSGPRSQGPPGMIHQDRLRDPNSAPRM